MVGSRQVVELGDLKGLKGLFQPQVFYDSTKEAQYSLGVLTALFCCVKIVF